MSERLQELERRLANKTAEIAVMGLGYVGLPMAMAFTEAGFRVSGIDRDAERVAQLNEGRSYVDDVPDAQVARAVQAGRFTAFTDPRELGRPDCIAIAVPTPLSKTKDPDLTYIVDCVEEIRRHLRSGQLVVLTSTTYPGTTHELYRPILESSGLRVGEDFCLAFAPERIDPGNRDFGFRDVPKVVGGETDMCTQLATKMFESVVENVVRVSSTQAAEMVKLLENTAWEIIDAAATKPYGFMKFTPGPGLGGHCIPVDPKYLAWKMRSLDFTPRFIELASDINSGMPRWVVDRAARALNRDRRSLNGARVLVIGAAYKPDVSDLRESPALDIMALLLESGAELTYHDPHVPSVQVESQKLNSVSLTEELIAESDLVLIATNHSTIDYAQIVGHAKRVLDTRNATSAWSGAAHVERL
jgi:UDP-N-acetyl-D-glucosamine dehydrogenase